MSERIADPASPVERVAALERAFGDDPSSEVFVDLVRALLDLDRARRASEVAQAGLAAHPDHAEGRLLYAEALLALGRTRACQREAARVLTLDAVHVPAMKLLGRALLETEQPEEAWVVLRRAQDAAPVDPEVRSMVAQAEEALRRHRDPTDDPIHVREPDGSLTDLEVEPERPARPEGFTRYIRSVAAAPATQANRVAEASGVIIDDAYRHEIDLRGDEPAPPPAGPLPRPRPGPAPAPARLPAPLPGDDEEATSDDFSPPHPATGGRTRESMSPGLPDDPSVDVDDDDEEVTREMSAPDLFAPDVFGDAADASGSFDADEGFDPTGPTSTSPPPVPESGHQRPPPPPRAPSGALDEVRRAFSVDDDWPDPEPSEPDPEPGVWPAQLPIPRSAFPAEARPAPIPVARPASAPAPEPPPPVVTPKPASAAPQAIPLFRPTDRPPPSLPSTPPAPIPAVERRAVDEDWLAVDLGGASARDTEAEGAKTPAGFEHDATATSGGTEVHPSRSPERRPSGASAPPSPRAAEDPALDPFADPFASAEGLRPTAETPVVSVPAPAFAQPAAPGVAAPAPVPAAGAPARGLALPRFAWEEPTDNVPRQGSMPVARDSILDPGTPAEEDADEGEAPRFGTVPLSRKKPDAPRPASPSRVRPTSDERPVRASAAGLPFAPRIEQVEPESGRTPAPPSRSEGARLAGAAPPRSETVPLEEMATEATPAAEPPSSPSEPPPPPEPPAARARPIAARGPGGRTAAVAARVDGPSGPVVAVVRAEGPAAKGPGRAEPSPKPAGRAEPSVAPPAKAGGRGEASPQPAAPARSVPPAARAPRAGAPAAPAAASARPSFAADPGDSADLLEIPFDPAEFADMPPPSAAPAAHPMPDDLDEPPASEAGVRPGDDARRPRADRSAGADDGAARARPGVRESAEATRRPRGRAADAAPEPAGPPRDADAAPARRDAARARPARSHEPAAEAPPTTDRPARAARAAEPEGGPGAERPARAPRGPRAAEPAAEGAGRAVRPGRGARDAEPAAAPGAAERSMRPGRGARAEPEAAPRAAERSMRPARGGPGADAPASPDYSTDYASYFDARTSQVNEVTDELSAIVDERRQGERPVASPPTLPAPLIPSRPRFAGMARFAALGVGVLTLLVVVLAIWRYRVAASELDTLIGETRAALADGNYATRVTATDRLAGRDAGVGPFARLGDLGARALGQGGVRARQLAATALLARVDAERAALFGDRPRLEPAKQALAQVEDAALPDAALAAALLALHEGRLAEAESRLADAPGEPDVLHVHALIAHADGRREAAVDRARTAADRDPRHVGARKLLADLKAARGDYLGALEGYEAILQTLAPDHVDTRIAMARLQIRIPKREQEAVARLKELLDPDAWKLSDLQKALVHDGIGLFYSNQGDFASARNAYAAALEAAPDDPHFSSGLARLDIRELKLDEAEERLTRAAELDRGGERHRVDLARVRLLRGDPKGALAHVAALRQPDADGLLLKGRALLALDDARSAETALTEALKLDAGLLDARIYLSLAAFIQGRRGLALGQLQAQRSTQAAGDQRLDDRTLPFRAYADALARDGDPRAAAGEYQRAVDINARDFLAHFGLCRMEADRLEAREALRHCREALAINPHYLPAAELLSTVAEAQEDAGAVAGALEPLLKKRAEPPPLVRRLARAYVALDRSDEALALAEGEHATADEATRRYTRGLVHARRGSIGEALPLLAGVADELAEDPWAQLAYAEALTKAGKSDQAGGFYRRALKVGAGARAALGATQAWLLQGEWRNALASAEDAERLAKQGLAHRRLRAEALALQARAWMQSGGGGAARSAALLDRAQRIEIDLPATLIALGQLAEVQGRPNEAVAHYGRATTVAPADPEGFYWLGRVERELGDSRDEGRQALRKAVQLDPEGRWGLRARRLLDRR